MNKNKKKIHKQTIPFLLATLSLLGLGLALFLVQNRQEIRQRASTPDGTTTITLNPQSSDLIVGQNKTIDVLINTNGLQTDGVQFKLNLEGNSSIQITKKDISGLNIITSVISGNTATYAAITSNPQAPFSTSIQTKIATITLNPNTAGDLALVFDPVFSKIVNSGTGEDILLTPTNGSYTTSTTASSPSPNPSPSTNPPDPSPTPPNQGGPPPCSPPSQAPTGISATSAGTNQVNLSWNPVSDASHYGISYGLSSGQYLYGAANVGNTTSFTVASLNSGTTYYFAVFAANSCGSSGYSQQVSTKTTGQITYNAPSPPPITAAAPSSNPALPSPTLIPLPASSSKPQIPSSPKPIYNQSTTPSPPPQSPIQTPTILIAAGTAIGLSILTIALIRRRNKKNFITEEKPIKQKTLTPPPPPQLSDKQTKV